MKIPQMPRDNVHLKWGPYPKEKLVNMILEYEKHLAKHKAQTYTQQYKRWDNLVKLARIALGSLEKKLDPDDISKKLKVSEATDPFRNAHERDDQI